MKLEFKLFLLSLVLVILGQTSLVVHLRQQAVLVSAPLYFGASQVGRALRNQASFWLFLKSLVQENRMLEEQVLELKSKLVEFKELERENERLRKQLGLKVKGKSNLLAVKVVGWEGVNRRCSVLINKGEESGVRVGMPVLIGKFLLGEIAAVEPHRARVRLITDPSFRIFAFDQDSKDQAKGIVRGFVPGKLIMEEIFKEEEISPGDTIVTSGGGERFPLGLVLGEVERVEEGDVLKKAVLDLNVDFSRLEEIFVLTEN